MHASLASLNYLSIGIGGTFRSTGQYKSTPAGIDTLLDHVRQHSVKHLALYFHGGLVSEQPAMTSAAVIAPAIVAGGAHPLMMIWQTGLGETLHRNLSDLAGTELFKKILILCLKVAAKRLGIDFESKGAAVALDDDAIKAELRKETPFEAFLADAPAATAAAPRTSDRAEQIWIGNQVEDELTGDTEFARLLVDSTQTAHLDPEVHSRIAAQAQSKGGFLLALAPQLGIVVFNVCKRYWKKRHHDFLPTVVEEILRVIFLANLGGTIWGDMKRSAGDMWAANDGLSGLDQHAGRYLLDRLSALDPQGVELDLIGHSAGSIAICKLFEAAASAGIKLPVRNVILMAPACTADMLWNEIASRPERYRRFRMFTMQDSYETRDHLLSHFYPRSLLYLVSGVLESETDSPLAGLERHLTGKAPYGSNVLRGTRRFLDKPGAERLVLSVTQGAAEGLRCSAIRHGGFAEDPQMLESIQHILRT